LAIDCAPLARRARIGVLRRERTWQRRKREETTPGSRTWRPGTAYRRHAGGAPGIISITVQAWWPGCSAAAAKRGGYPRPAATLN